MRTYSDTAFADIVSMVVFRVVDAVQTSWCRQVVSDLPGECQRFFSALDLNSLQRQSAIPLSRFFAPAVRAVRALGKTNLRAEVETRRHSSRVTVDSPVPPLVKLSVRGCAPSNGRNCRSDLALSRCHNDSASKRLLAVVVVSSQEEDRRRRLFTMEADAYFVMDASAHILYE